MAPCCLPRGLARTLRLRVDPIPTAEGRVAALLSHREAFRAGAQMLRLSIAPVERIHSGNKARCRSGMLRWSTMAAQMLAAERSLMAVASTPLKPRENKRKKKQAAAVDSGGIKLPMRKLTPEGIQRLIMPSRRTHFFLLF